MSVDLLDMLAEVASNSLQHDASLAGPSRLCLKEAKGARNTTRQLLKLFSKFDGDEMRRKFTFTCLFDVGGCEATFSSFGSELKARQNVIHHLFDHVQRAGGISDGIFKRRKTQAKRKSSERRDKVQHNPEHCRPDSKHAIVKKLCEAPSNVNIKFVPSSNGRRTYKFQKCDSKHFCWQSKCVNASGNAWHPAVQGPHQEHNYSAQKTSACGTSSDSPSPASDGLRLVEMIETQDDHLELSSLNNFMVHEVDQLDVLVPCLENNIRPQLTKLPPVGEEVSIITTPAPATTEGISPFTESGVRASCTHPADSKSGGSSAFVVNAAKYSSNPTAAIETHAAAKMTDKEMAIKLISEAKNKGASHPLQCTICSPQRQFTALTTLVSHYRSHAGIKPFECLVCHRSFTRQHSLNYHLLIHENVTRFTCSHCARKFRHPSHYREHLRKHTGEEPFHCSDCTARFKTRNTFKRHLRSRHSKVLTASGEVFRLEMDETVSRPGETQVTCPAETSKLGDVDKENSRDRNAKAKAGCCLETNGKPIPSEPVGVVKGDFTREELANDGNNNASNQSAFFVVDKDISNPSIYFLPKSAGICKM